MAARAGCSHATASPTSVTPRDTLAREVVAARCSLFIKLSGCQRSRNSPGSITEFPTRSWVSRCARLTPSRQRGDGVAGLSVLWPHPEARRQERVSARPEAIGAKRRLPTREALTGRPLHAGARQVNESGRRESNSRSQLGKSLRKHSRGRCRTKPYVAVSAGPSGGSLRTAVHVEEMLNGSGFTRPRSSSSECPSLRPLRVGLTGKAACSVSTHAPVRARARALTRRCQPINGA